MIVVDGLVKELGGRRVLDGVTFTAPTGGVTGLLGPNGAGKTTTMRVLATLLRPDGGRVEIGGHDVRREPEAVRRAIGLVTEEPGLHDRLTVREQLRFTAGAYGLDRASTVRRPRRASGSTGLRCAGTARPTVCRRTRSMRSRRIATVMSMRRPKTVSRSSTASTGRASHCPNARVCGHM